MAPLLVMMMFLCASYVDAVCEDEDVRLGDFGRVEYCLGGRWGAVCLDSGTSPWSEKNAQVACKQLGFTGALNSVLPNEALAVPDGTPYLLGSVQCYGNETSLAQCNSTNVMQCTSGRPAAVSCRSRFAGDHDVRLVGSPMNGMGAVEIYTRNGLKWINVCPDSSVWSDATANAVCVQLGYKSGQTMTFTLMSDANIADRRVIDVNCTDAFTLPECDFELLPTTTSSCSAATNMYAGVNCTSSSDPEGSVRLFGVKGVNNTEGRVEILYNGKWGTVCRDALWANTDGETVCRQLGFDIESINQVNTRPTGSYAGPSNNRPIWLGRLQCNSSSSALGGCVRLDRAVGSAIHCMDHNLNNDAAVNCNRTTFSKGIAITQNLVYVSCSALLVLYTIIILF